MRKINPIHRLRKFRTGDIDCFGVNLTEFRAKCQIPLFKNQWNLWEIAYASEKPADKHEISKSVSEWFETQVDFLAKVVDSRDYHSLEVSLEPPETASSIKRFQECLPFTSTFRDNIGSHTKAYVRFVYRGEKSTYDWPLYNESALQSEDCPLGVTWIATTIFRPPTDRPIPDKPTVLDDVVPIPNPTKSVSGALLWGGVGLGAALIVYAMIK